MNLMMRSYSELMQIHDYLGRYKYLRLGGKVGEETFGWERYLNQSFYKSKVWRDFRREMILRDNGCDLAHEDHPFGFGEVVFLHHINPIKIEDIVKHTELLLDPENVICVRKRTHDAIHYGDETLLAELEYIPRTPYDTCLWKLKRPPDYSEEAFLINGQR